MSISLKNIRIARVSTVPFFIFTQLRTQLEVLIDSGADVSVITSNDSLSDNLQIIKGGTVRSLYIAREISLVADLVTLFKLWNMFHKEQFDIVHSTTPKAGLLCAIAAKLAGVTICLHTFTGQPWITMIGFKKKVLQACDKLIARLNTKCYTDSFTQRDFLINNKIAHPGKLEVIGKGSLAGVNIQRFDQELYSDGDRKRLRDSLGIDHFANVVLFVGRISREKGIFELIDAVSKVLQDDLNVVLLVVGPFEQNNETEIRSYANQKCANNVIFSGFQTDPERYMSISDFLCLPSYREGFGTVVIEAAAMGLPTIGTKIYGLTDAIIDGVTGLLVEPKNCIQLAEAIGKLIAHQELKNSLGAEAKKRALADFDSKYCSELLVKEYRDLLDSSLLKK